MFVFVCKTAEVIDLNVVVVGCRDSPLECVICEHML